MSAGHAVSHSVTLVSHFSVIKTLFMAIYKNRQGKQVLWLHHGTNSQEKQKQI